jgi:hypothetical protein
MGFYILEDNNPNSLPDTASVAIFIAAIDSVSIIFNVQDLTKYIHIQAIDSAGNLSAVTTLAPIPIISYSDTAFCATGTAAIIHQGPTTGGPYNASPSGLSINSSTGLINLETSAPGTYIVTYNYTTDCLPVTTSVTIHPMQPYSVSIVESGNNICDGTSVTFTANVSGSATPAYQWKVNGVSIIGETNATYTYLPANGDIISCDVTSNDICATPPTATSNNITMMVIPNVIPSISITTY